MGPQQFSPHSLRAANEDFLIGSGVYSSHTMYNILWGLHSLQTPPPPMKITSLRKRKIEMRIFFLRLYLKYVNLFKWKYAERSKADIYYLIWSYNCTA